MALCAGVVPVRSASGGVDVLEWPLRQGLRSIGEPRPGRPDERCAVLRGSELATVLALTGQARFDGIIRRWRSDDAVWDVSMYAVLPGEKGCR